MNLGIIRPKRGLVFKIAGPASLQLIRCGTIGLPIRPPYADLLRQGLFREKTEVCITLINYFRILLNVKIKMLDNHLPGFGNFCHPGIYG